MVSPDREKSFRIFPWVCARCGREFGNKNVHQLTVHHRDNDHTNNPLNSSNWELLCIYCHDNAHLRGLDTDGFEALAASDSQALSATYKPFAGLKDLLNKKKA